MIEITKALLNEPFILFLIGLAIGAIIIAAKEKS